MLDPLPVRAGRVEAPLFFPAGKEGRPYDTLRANGEGVSLRA
jgi:hypothetical protein